MMAAYEEMLEIIKTQQTVIEKLTAASRHQPTVTKSHLPRVSAKRAVKRQEGRRDIKDIIWNSVIQTV